jgi:hypothetical protein
MFSIDNVLALYFTVHSIVKHVLVLVKTSALIIFALEIGFVEHGVKGCRAYSKLCSLAHNDQDVAVLLALVQPGSTDIWCNNYNWASHWICRHDVMSWSDSNKTGTLLVYMLQRISVYFRDPVHSYLQLHERSLSAYADGGISILTGWTAEGRTFWHLSTRMWNACDSSSSRSHETLRSTHRNSSKVQTMMLSLTWLPGREPQAQHSLTVGQFKL